MSVQLDRRAEELRLRVVRRPLQHDSAPKHVAGSAIFVDDMREPEGLLHIAVGGAPVAAGPLLGIDLDAVRAALARSDRRIKGRLRIGGQEHFYLEGQVSLAIPGEDGDMLVYCSTQHPSECQHLIAKVLKIPDVAVTVEVRRMGGAFGGKETQ